MKTIEEAAEDYAQRTDKENAEWVMKDFLAGVEFAQRWISVEEELPPQERSNGESERVFVKDEDGHRGFCRYNHKSRKWTNGSLYGDWMGVTHWRYIELKQES
jgi:hypothetical protein